MNVDEYVQYDATGLAELVRKGEVSRKDLIEAAIEALERVNPQLNGLVERTYARARAGIKEINATDGPLSGVPFLIKDNIEIEGVRVTYGMTLALDNIAKRTHELVKRIEASGLVMLGTTNMCEMGLLPNTEPVAHGPTRNPWNTAHSPGGSSGGSAALVAAGAVPMAHAADGGGSIRIPASACHLFGLKPSRGRMPVEPWDDPDCFVSHGCISRTVRDSAAYLDAVHGARPGNRFQLAPPAKRYVEYANEDPKPLRIALVREGLAGTLPDAHCRRALDDMAKLCESLGHHIEPATYPFDGERFLTVFEVLWGMAPGHLLRKVVGQAHGRVPAAVAKNLHKRSVLRAVLAADGYRQHRRFPLEPLTWRMTGLDAEKTPAWLWQTWETFDECADALATFFESYDVILTPTLGKAPWPIGHVDQKAPIDVLKGELFSYVAYTPVNNALGLPGMSVPIHRTERKLPIGTHFSAAWGREDLLFQLAGQIERERPWAQDRPGVFAA